jgi:D-tyrosyl-tRNA(Tyr) deacylase
MPPFLFPPIQPSQFDGAVVSSIGPGLLCLVGLAKNDTPRELAVMSRRILRLRAFEKAPATEEGPAPAAAQGAAPWTASVTDIHGEVLLVSQFTLHARTHKRSRPDFSRAMPPGEASGRWSDFVSLVRREALASGAKGVSDGVFGAMMHVRINNDGPVTFLLDTEESGGGTSASGAASEGTAATATGDEGGGEETRR